MKARMASLPLAAIAAIAAMNALAAEVEPGSAEFELKLRFAGFAEGARDLGLVDENGLPFDEDGETAEGYVDIQPELYWRMSQDWALYARAQGFAPSGAVVVTDEESPRSTEAYAALREAWVEYGGLTSYPGELLRVGRQRLRERDGTWWDRDVESVRWIFDTTLLQVQFGAAAQLATFRTDDSELPVNQQDRAYAFTMLSGQWSPEHFFGARSAFAWDYGDTEDDVAAGDPDAKRVDRRYFWVGLAAHNGYYERPDDLGLYYWLQVDFLAGARDQLLATGDPQAPVLTVGTDVRAWAGDFGLRARLAKAFAIGAAYAYGQGGGDATEGRIESFEQTGLQSNRSRFTGTRSLLYRFGEALQPDLSNLQVASVFVSVPLDRFDASLVYHRFLRNEGDAPVLTDGIDVAPVNDSHDLGTGYDVVLATYFGTTPSIEFGDREDLRSNVRLRGSVFQPGDAYGQRLDDQYRVTLELTLWF